MQSQAILKNKLPAFAIFLEVLYKKIYYRRRVEKRTTAFKLYRGSVKIGLFL
jgi:hypothetical protein